VPYDLYSVGLSINLGSRNSEKILGPYCKLKGLSQPARTTITAGADKGLRILHRGYTKRTGVVCQMGVIALLPPEVQNTSRSAPL